MTTTLTHTQLSDQITAMRADATYLDRLDPWGSTALPSAA